MTIAIRRVDFHDPVDSRAFVEMLDVYARDEMGDGIPLSASVRERLADRLSRRSNSLGWVAWRDDQPVGVLAAFVGFSTFAAEPLLNIHDVSVVPTARRSGVAGQLLSTAEEHARAIGCVSLTLEVRGDNESAKRLYERFGFSGAKTCEPSDGFLFWKKRLD